MDRTQDAPASLSKKNQSFLEEVLRGLKEEPKQLSSKYFYDKTGDKLFQKIMRCPEYYLSRCEQEILSEQAGDIANAIQKIGETFDLVGLGAGDGSKAVILLQEFLKKNLMGTYYPVDISANVISLLEQTLPQQVPELKLKGFNGEYMEMLKQINAHSSKQKMVLFLGSNIGNFEPAQALEFCKHLNKNLQKGDLLFIGFDLKKHPKVILDAYNDKQGYTRAFNLNLLTRINKELNADFDTNQFEHFPTYDPGTGTCKSYLISLKEQKVQIGAEQLVSFKRNEAIHTEISQKYNQEEISNLARDTGFEQVDRFFDTKEWFVDCLWRCK